ncbi:hypothetical protein DRO97_02625 [Archaeoglobales archaeon]|nr:MAG: hypothetical protein DRO97_02625 [Archaeoglobales archaeon]
MPFEDTYAEYYDIIYSDKDYTKECDFLEEVFTKYSKIPVNTILDVGCGTGNHAKELINRGYTVTGIEPSYAMAKLAICKGVNVILGKPLDFPNFNKKFDAVISMFTVIGYIHDTDELIETFKWIGNNTRQLFIFDFWNGLAVIKHRPLFGVKSVNNIIRYKYPKLDAKNHLVKVKHKIYDRAKLVTEEEHVVRFYFPKEIEHYLNEAGFKLLGLFPCWDLERVITEEDWDIVAVAEVVG